MRFECRSSLNHAAATVFDWHSRPGAFERLSPPWETVRLLAPHPGVIEGSLARFAMRLGPIPFVWEARHSEIAPGRQFVDTMERGPFAAWRHRHVFESTGANTSTLSDEIEYQLPMAPFSGLAADHVRHQLARTFRYRHDVTVADLDLHGSHSRGPLTVAITGASGLVGRTLSAMLTTGGHVVVPLVRRAPKPGERQWTPGAVDPRPFAGVDAVVHLAGESIAEGRWSVARQAEIRKSRSVGTATLAASLVAADPRPMALVCASAVGFYGDRGDQVLGEDDRRGTGFLADVAADWEAATAPASQANIRTITARFGIILSPRGGALGRMLLPFQLGVGGRLGSGRQWMSWISIDDCAGALVHLLGSTVAGPVNVVAPDPVTNASFTTTLGAVVGRPTICSVPAPVLRLALGGIADEGLLASQRAVPTRLTTDGYRFRHATLESALRHVLGRNVR